MMDLGIGLKRSNKSCFNENIKRTVSDGLRNITGLFTVTKCVSFIKWNSHEISNIVNEISNS